VAEAAGASEAAEAAGAAEATGVAVTATGVAVTATATAGGAGGAACCELTSLMVCLNSPGAPSLISPDAHEWACLSQDSLLAHAAAHAAAAAPGANPLAGWERGCALSHLVHQCAWRLPRLQRLVLSWYDEEDLPVHQLARCLQPLLLCAQLEQLLLLRSSRNCGAIRDDDGGAPPPAPSEGHLTLTLALALALTLTLTLTRRAAARAECDVRPAGRPTAAACKGPVRCGADRGLPRRQRLAPRGAGWALALRCGPRRQAGVGSSALPSAFSTRFVAESGRGSLRVTGHGCGPLVA
jgi:hypothetical protein